MNTSWFCQNEVTFVGGCVTGLLITDKAAPDVRFNFLRSNARAAFYKSVAETKADAALITGDIAEAKDVCEILCEFSHSFNKPIYFVLGNHDYYSGSVSGVREKILTLCHQNK